MISTHRWRTAWSLTWAPHTSLEQYFTSWSIVNLCLARGWTVYTPCSEKLVFVCSILCLVSWCVPRLAWHSGACDDRSWLRIDSKSRRVFVARHVNHVFHEILMKKESPCIAARSTGLFELSNVRYSGHCQHLEARFACDSITIILLI